MSVVRALYHKWDVKNGFSFVLQFFSLISDGLGGVLDEISKCSKFVGPHIIFSKGNEGKSCEITPFMNRPSSNN